MNLDIVIRAHDQASRGLRNIQGATGKLGGALQKLGKIALLGAAVGFVALGTAALKFGSDFQSAFATISKGTGATGEALEGLKEDFKRALKNVPDSMDKVATATADLNTRLGLTGPELSETTTLFLDFARITGTDVAEAVRNGTRVFGDWSIATNDQGKAMDHMFKVSQTTGIGVDKLMTQVVNFGAPLRQMGFSFEDATVLMGKWEKEGVNTEAILGALKIGVNNFAKAGIEGGAGMQDFIKQITKMGPGVDALALASETFGSRAGPDMAAAVLEGRFTIEDYTAAVGDSRGAISGAAKAARTWQENLSILKNKVLVKLEPVLTKLIDKLTDFSGWLERRGIPLAEDFGRAVQEKMEPWIQRLRTAFDNLRGPAEEAGRVLIKIIKFLDDNREVLAAIAIAIAIVLVPAFVAWAVAAGAAAIATLLAVAPILLLVAAIALIVLGIILLVKHWDEVTAFLKKAWKASLDFVVEKAIWLKDQIVEKFGLIKDKVLDIINLLWEKFKENWFIIFGLPIFLIIKFRRQILEKFNDIKDKVIGVIIKLKDGAIGKFQDLLGWIQDLPGRVLTAIGSLGSLLFDKGKDILRGLWDGLKNLWRLEVQGWLNIKQKVLNAIGFVGAFLFDVGKDIIRGLWNGMKNIWSALIGWLTDKINLLPGFLKDFLGISSPSKVFADIGRNMMLGLQVGMENGIRGVERLMGRLTGTLSIGNVSSSFTASAALATSSPSLFAAGSGVGSSRLGGGITINMGPINLSGSASQQDADDLVDMVERGLRSRTLRGR